MHFREPGSCTSGSLDRALPGAWIVHFRKSRSCTSGSLDRALPGVWIVHFRNQDVDSRHCITAREQQVDVEPGEERAAGAVRRHQHSTRALQRGHQPLMQFLMLHPAAPCCTLQFLMLHPAAPCCTLQFLMLHPAGRDAAPCSS